jgi:acetylornithine deacetylase
VRVTRGDAVGLLRALVRADSRNPTLVPGGPGEGEIARLLSSVLDAWGFSTELMEAAPGRHNVIARIGTRGARSLMFNGHLDVVGVEDMTHAPFDAEEREGRIYGRGASDMKGGVAAMCAAAARAADSARDGEIIIAAVVDEEYESLGTRELVRRGVRADAAIVTEPTRLAIMPAHRGFIWYDVELTGRAAHGSRYDIGVDAILHAGLVLGEVGVLDGEILASRPHHTLLGRPSIHASLIEGGTGMSTYPERCNIKLERRTLPGEQVASALAEVEEACARARRRRPELKAEVRQLLAQAPSDVPTSAPIVRALDHALRQCGEEVRVEGMSAWTDAAILNDAGMPAICFGPGDMSLAHAAEEYIVKDEVERATEVLARLATQWCGSGDGAWHS